MTNRFFLWASCAKCGAECAGQTTTGSAREVRRHRTSSQHREYHWHGECLACGERVGPAETRAMAQALLADHDNDRAVATPSLFGSGDE